MEHYLGEKLKKLRESRGWTQADLAKRLNKAVSTISGYESDAHAIPLDPPHPDISSTRSFTL